LLLVFVLGHYLNIFRPLENIFIKILNPIFSGFNSVGLSIKNTYSDRADKAGLLNSFKDMKARENILIEENAKLKTIQDENELLRGYLNFFTKSNYKYVMSNVVSRGSITDTLKTTETFVIDKGQKDGLVEGLAVVNNKGIIIGKVAEVKDNLAKVFLVNSSQCKLAATIFNSDKTSGIAEGELGLTILMKFIPQTQKINKNDLVLTSGLETLIPRGLAIGMVTEINGNSNDLWQSAVIEPLSNPDDLTIVSVLLK
jgi:rod shape-determining protein MreC